MSARPGNSALFEQLAADGITHMFGNPGTVEQGFLDLADGSPLTYVLALHESVALAMADGYARASQRPAVVQLHSGVGLGNGIGMLYQALRGGSPLVALVGEAGLAYDAMDAQMACDLVTMARPVTKYATRVVDPASLLRVLRRAVKIAMTPPRGPVAVVLPADVMEQHTLETALPTTVPALPTRPGSEQIRQAAKLLTEGERRLILIGDGVAASGAQAELRAVAELLGARVWGVNSSEVNFDTTHPLFAGNLPHMSGTDSARAVAGADSVLIVGTYLFPEVFPHRTSPFQQDVRSVHIDADPYEIAKNFPVDLPLAADPRLTLKALADELTRHTPDTAAATTRPTPAAAAGAGAGSRAGAGAGGMMGRFAAELAAQAPGGLTVFDEALTASPALTAQLPPRLPGTYFQTRGGSLGVGIPGALGIKLARPKDHVVGFSGDGGSMYTIQALWTAARYGIDAKFVICNNRRYKLLDLNIEEYWRARSIPRHAYPDAFDLSRPDIRFAELAGSLGVEGTRVEHPGQIEAAVTRMLTHDGPYLIDLITT
ncbi:thiamine pyrophosphate-binding protein [Streptomyces purpureus]|uniref:Benzoylformate decarboxylase n=1 Tax=Streptomyces purpureus TaxID=1951 RepID=A0A918LWX0_9ACTN|nr:thiamine pyrophosphate-binding protein [Streptomyces purpureus]GGT64256.1 benzoylformate decarboxylase [Streptomyces purpureus]